MARTASRRWERSVLAVNGEAPASGAVVTKAELEGGEVGRRCPIVPSKLTLSTECGKGRFRPLGGGKAGDRREAGKAVQAARPVGDDTSRTSISEGKAGEEESLDIIQDGVGAPLWQKYDLSRGLVNHTIRVWITEWVLKSRKNSQLRQGGESRRQFYEDSTGICTVELTRRVLVGSLL